MATQSLVGTKNRSGQVVTDPWKMMHEAERSPCFFTGSEVIKEAIRRANCDVMIAYPITPQSEAAALIGELFAEGFIGDYFRGESEFAVMSQCAGAAFGGARVFTTTAGPGTMRAMENFPMWAGARLPIQMIVTCRGINSPLSIQPDTLEISYLLNTGMLVWHAETAQDFYDWILKGYMVSEEPDVHLPLALCCDGFFVTHTKDVVNLTPADMCLPPYDPYRSPVPCMDMECPPVRMMRDPFVMKSNYISYATHASWQQEVWAAVERSRKHAIRWLDGLIEVDRPDAEILIVSSGTAVSQGREAQALLEEDGIEVGIVKVKTLRPWPEEEIRQATKNAKHIIVPEFNVTGWLAKEIRATIPDADRVYAGPHVCGGMTMPPEVIAADIKKHLGIKAESLAGRGS
ncbi:MAG: ferredoxin oxidoreductase [Nitrospira sp. SB0677_bin_15]|nr:ferredoxin oxidoreductase [Nitrospira sp. SB0667_bin_9]MYD31493.1 ferredoxin oxidoreductase [Nitrospira sp. SB0661_bin_20]MYG40036.1 ferredoxin oxidoreductase [Nitrospira sp. SB0677_bin_15]MYH03085.1 ferredoxin oxidoreductase [Nitrospira sp. SB0675_bin_23]MYJ22127.1 ferredoxin oxidoreductase [Nitrospira sp. SB0673_bin_12]